MARTARTLRPARTTDPRVIHRTRYAARRQAEGARTTATRRAIRESSTAL